MGTRVPPTRQKPLIQHSTGRASKWLLGGAPIFTPFLLTMIITNHQDMHLVAAAWHNVGSLPHPRFTLFVQGQPLQVLRFTLQLLNLVPWK